MGYDKIPKIVIKIRGGTSIKKQRSVSITLLSLTKVCIVKAMVFPVVMYGCETRTIKKPEY